MHDIFKYSPPINLVVLKENSYKWICNTVRHKYNFSLLISHWASSVNSEFFKGKRGFGWHKLLVNLALYEEKVSKMQTAKEVYSNIALNNVTNFAWSNICIQNKEENKNINFQQSDKRKSGLHQVFMRFVGAHCSDYKKTKVSK